MAPTRPAHAPPFFVSTHIRVKPRIKKEATIDERTVTMSDAIGVVLRIPGDPPQAVAGRLVVADDGFFDRESAFGAWRARAPTGPDPDGALDLIAQRLRGGRAHVTPKTFHPSMLEPILRYWGRFADGEDPNAVAREFARQTAERLQEREIAALPVHPVTGYVRIDDFLERRGTSVRELMRRPEVRRDLQATAREMGVPLDVLIHR